MLIYLSGFSTRELEEYIKRVPQAKLNVLLSYGLKNSDYRNFLEKSHENINSVILDSGAFTANFSSKPQDLSFIFQGYKSFCQYYANSYDFAINYDLDFGKGDYSNNYKYLDELRKAGINVVPVVHDYTGDEVDLYLNGDYKIIATGYSEEEKTKNNLAELAKKIYDAGRKVHALGVSNFSWLATTPIHYSDSSSWAKYSAYGFMPFWNSALTSQDKTHIIKFTDFKKQYTEKHLYSNYAYKQDLEKYLHDRLGYKYIDLLSPETNRRRIVCIDYYVQLQDVLTRLHARLGFHTDV